MDVLHLIDRLEEIVAESRRLPIGGGVVVILGAGDGGEQHTGEDGDDGDDDEEFDEGEGASRGGPGAVVVHGFDWLAKRAGRRKVFAEARVR